MLRSFKSHPLGSQLRDGSVQNVGVDYSCLPRLRSRRHAAKGYERQRTFALGSKSQGATATGNIYCRSQIYKKNNFFPEDKFIQIQGFAVWTDGVCGLVSKIGLADNLAE